MRKRTLEERLLEPLQPEPGVKLYCAIMLGGMLIMLGLKWLAGE